MLQLGHLEQFGLELANLGVHLATLRAVSVSWTIHFGTALLSMNWGDLRVCVCVYIRCLFL